MSVRKTSLVPNEFYHIYNRGNSKQVIFHDKEDYQRFIKLLYLLNTTNNFRLRDTPKDFYSFDRGQNLVYIVAYCLMPNHFHLVVIQPEDGSISKFIQRVTTAYSMYYNVKYKHSGSLFEGKFKSKHVDNDKYLKYLFSYVHLNPVKLIQNDWKEKGINDKNKTLEFLSKYKYSSYLDFFDSKREENAILNRKVFPEYFPNNKEMFQKEIFEWLSYGE